MAPLCVMALLEQTLEWDDIFTLVTFGNVHV